jgi:hypothetical protein
MAWRLRDSFIARDGYVEKFEYVWGVVPTCCRCGRKIKDGEKIRWGKSAQPETLHHERCA